jgi:hypothetical protein
VLSKFFPIRLAYDLARRGELSPRGDLTRNPQGEDSIISEKLRGIFTVTTLCGSCDTLISLVPIKPNGLCADRTQFRPWSRPGAVIERNCHSDLSLWARFGSDRSQCPEQSQRSTLRPNSPEPRARPLAGRGRPIEPNRRGVIPVRADQSQMGWRVGDETNPIACLELPGGTSCRSKPIERSATERTQLPPTNGWPVTKRTQSAPWRQTAERTQTPP